MPTTKADIDNFYKYATGLLEGEEAAWTLEECVLRWRRQRAGRSVSPEPFPDGGSLRDQLIRTGILGRNCEGPDDVASNPEYMKGFGER